MSHCCYHAIQLSNYLIIIATGASLCIVSGKDGGNVFLIDNIKILRPVIGDYIVDVLV
jgi:hypothetical protein